MINAILSGKTELTDAEHARWKRESQAVLNSPNASQGRKVAILQAVRRVCRARLEMKSDPFDFSADEDHK